MTPPAKSPPFSLSFLGRALRWSIRFVRPLEQPEAIRREMARLLTRLFMFSAPIVAVYGLGTMFFNRDDPPTVVSGILIISSGGLLWIASRISRRGHTILAFAVIILGVPTILAAGAAIAGGLLGVRLLYYNALIIFACGWFLGPQPTLVLTAYILALLVGSPLYVTGVDAWLLARTAMFFNFMVWIVVLLIGLYQTRLEQLRLALARDSDLRYQRMIEQIHDLVIVTDLQGTILSINHQSERFCGLPPQAMIGRDVREILYREDRPQYASGISKLFVQSSTPTFEVRVVPLTAPPDTPPIWVEVTASLARIIARDITRRREAEEALRASEARYRLISETISDYVGTVISDSSRVLKWEWVTDSLQRVTGFHPDEMQGKLPSYWYHPEDYPRVLADWERVRKGEIVEGEYRVPMKTGGYKWLRITRRPTVTKDGLMRVYIIGRDISEQKAAEAQMVELVREQERFQTINQFVRAVSHDFRTALSVIETSVYMLNRSVRSSLDEPLQTQMDARLKAIRDSVSHMVSQLDNMRMVAASSRTDAQLMDLAQITRQIAERARPLCDARALTLECSGTDGPALIRAGESEIVRAINHVLENALTHTPPGGTIALRIEHVPGAVRLHISDTGPGIAAEHLPFLFDPFYRVDPARTTSAGGVGFGLTIAKLLIEMYDGAIAVESRLGEGSCFTLTFPDGEQAVDPSAPPKV